MKKVYVLFFLIFSGVTVWAQTVVTVGGGASVICPATPTATWTTPPVGVTFSNWSRGSGVTCATAANAISGSGFNTANVAASFAANKYYAVTLTADATHTFTLDAFSWMTQLSGTTNSCSFTLQYVNNGGPLTTFGTAGQTITSSGAATTFNFTGSVSVSAGTSIIIYAIPHTATAAGTTVRWINGSTITVTASSTSTPTKLAVTNINPTSPTVNAAFAITVQAQDGSNTASNVVANTDVAISLNFGSGALGGTLTGTISAGTNSVVITGVTYNTVENGVIVTATRSAGDVLTPGNSAPFNVLAAASQLVLVAVPATGYTNTNLTTFTVEARRPDNSVDATYTSNITIQKVTGPGNVIGTVTVAAVAGVATFNAVQIDAIGIYTINATDGVITSSTSGNIVITPPPTLNEFLLPQYIQGVNGTNNNRLPYVYRASLNFLVPNTTYRYTNLAVTTAELLTPLTGGAGNQIFYNSAGNFTRYALGASLSVAGAYGTFTTDATGSYTGWFITEPTGNARFTPGTQLYMRILLNDGLGGSTAVLSLTTLNSAVVTNLGAIATDGTGIYGMTHTANRDLVFLYDNMAGTGRPLTSTFIEDDGTSGGAQYPSFYQTNVDANAKSWGTFIPNTLANGVRKIQYMNAGGNKVYAVTSTDGVWPGVVSTINPTGGSTALAIDRAATGTSGDFIVDSAVTLASPVLVNNSLTLNNGIVTSTALNLLTIPNGGSTTGVSNASFVNGPVSKIGNTLFTFPVGRTNCGPSNTANGYAPISISAPATITDRFTAEYVHSSATALGPITAIGLQKVSACDYWKLDQVSGANTIDVTLNWSDPVNNCTTASPYVNNLPALVVAHFDGVSSSWDTYGATSTACCSPASGTVVYPGVSVFSPFAIGSIDFSNPLPITINYFTGTRSNGNHLLNWKVTCASVPSATIEIERSTDGRTYSSVYSIFATALRCQQPFDYTDNQPAKGINYYRLKMTDADGKVTYSTTVTLINAVKGIDVMNIAPNPVVNSTFNLQISSADRVQMKLVITDIQGRIVSNQSVNLIAGFNTIPMIVKNLAAGTYQLFGYAADEKTRVLRFVIQ